VTKVAFGLSMMLALVVGFVAGKHHKACDPGGLPAHASQPARVGKLDRSPQLLSADSTQQRAQAQKSPGEELPCAAEPSRNNAGNFTRAGIEAEEMRAQRRAESLARRAAAEYSSDEIDAAGKDVGATQAAIEPSQQEIGGWPAGSVEAEELGAQQRAELAAAEAEAEYSSDLKPVGIRAGTKAP
jgi:hypothetical protein